MTTENGRIMRVDERKKNISPYLNLIFIYDSSSFVITFKVKEIDVFLYIRHQVIMLDSVNIKRKWEKNEGRNGR